MNPFRRGEYGSVVAWPDVTGDEWAGPYLGTVTFRISYAVYGEGGRVAVNAAGSSGRSSRVQLPEPLALAVERALPNPVWLGVLHKLRPPEVEFAEAAVESVAGKFDWVYASRAALMYAAVVGSRVLEKSRKYKHTVLFARPL